MSRTSDRLDALEQRTNAFIGTMTRFVEDATGALTIVDVQGQHLDDLCATVAKIADEPRSWLDSMCRRAIIVHCDWTDGPSTIEGVLSDVTADGIVLHAASLWQGNGDKLPLAGDTFIPRHRVRFTQLDDGHRN